MNLARGLVLLALAGCQVGTTQSTTATLADVPRAELNARALRSGLPLFWSDDANHDGALQPAELALVWGLDGAEGREHWVRDGAFTPAFHEAYARLKTSAPAAPADARHAALAKELDQSYFTVLESDFTSAPAAERAFVGHILAAARIVESIYARQLGTHGMEKQLPAGDGLARLAYFLNQGPWCSGPATEKDPGCNALEPAPARLSGLYPADLQAEQGFCEKLAKHPRAEALTDPFTVVGRDAEGELTAVPYTRAYEGEMLAVSRELTAAGAVLGPEETALKAYLAAAARAFTDNDWFAADEAWARMSAASSKWYLRIGPDEVYYEPCNLKAGFHVSFARINAASLAWQRRLEPVKADMEKTLAAMAGAPYAARPVSFRLPDFIDIVVNAGDARDARGATIGQSLPNWGPVANEGRGRTVAMTNFYTDADSLAIAREQSSSLFCAEVMARYSDDRDATVIGTVLHEAAHNLGPSHEYRVRGKTDDQVFGGPLASTLEELKAQSSALFLTDWLVEKGVVGRELAEQAHVRDLAWAFGHISRGMYDAEGKIKPYSALASIQVGFLLARGAIGWQAETLAANGKDRGCFSIDFARLPAAVVELETIALGVKARGDVAKANELVNTYVDASGSWKQVRDVIGERYLRFPRASFLYSVRL